LKKFKNLKIRIKPRPKSNKKDFQPFFRGNQKQVYRKWITSIMLLKQKGKV
jgi:hypothetical protein